jgi:far upstream element-binding protein
MSDAVSRAREIAARLASKAGGGGGGDKRKLGEITSQATLNMEVKRKKIFVPQNPEVNYLGLLLGPRGSTHRELSDSTGAKIFIRGQGSRRDMAGEAQIGDDEALHVVVEGNLDAIDKATAKINDLLYNTDAAMKLKGQQLTDLAAASGNHANRPPPPMDGMAAPSNEVTELMHVDLPHIGAIIGKGGENISRLTTQSGAKMRIQRIEDMTPDSRTRVITLIGNPPNVQDLRARVQAIIDGRAMQQQSQQMPNQYANPNPYQQQGPPPPQGQGGRPILENSNIVMKVPIPNDKVGIIIGKGGSQIKAIKERSKCEVHIPTQPDVDNPEVRTLSIGGDNEEAVKGAYNEISSVLTQHAANQTGAGGGNTANKTPTIVLTVPDEKVGTVIGRAGVTIKDLQARNNVKVIIPTSADPGSIPPVRTLSIFGDPTAANATKIEIERLVEATGQRPHGGGQKEYNANSEKGFGGTTAATYGPGSSGGNANASAGSQQSSAQDPTMYYADFWVYASHYGEKAARLYYADWSPPVGTPAPPGTTVAPDKSEEQLKAAAAGTGSNSGQQAQAQNQGPQWEKYAAEYKQWWELHGRAQGAPEDPPAM